MKKPLLNQIEREAIRFDTFLGANLKLKLATIRLRREVFRQHGFIALKRLDYALDKSLNKIFSPTIEATFYEHGRKIK